MAKTDINEIVVHLRSLGFQKFLEDTGSSIKNANQLAKALDLSDTSSVKGLKSWAEAAKASGKISEDVYKSIVKSINAFNDFKKTLTGQNKIDFNIAFKAYIDQRKLNKDLSAAAAKVQPDFTKAVADLQSKIALSASGAKNFGFKIDETKFLKKDFSSIDPNVRIAALQKVIPLLEEEFKRQVAITEKEKDKADLAQRYLTFINAIQAQALRGPATSVANTFQDSRTSKDNLDSINRTADAQRNLARATRDTAKATAEATDKAQKLKDEHEKLNKSIGIAVGKLIRYRVAFYAMRAAIDSVVGSIERFSELSLQLAQLKKVIDPNTESIEVFEQQAFRLAQTFGVTANDIVEAFKIWAQAGLKQNEVLKATEATLVGVNSIGLDAVGVTEALTAAIFTYGESIENLLKIESKWLAVEREFPVSAADLANAIKIVGSAARTVGVDLDDLSGYVVAIGSATRKSGVAVGQSIKTMFAELPKKETIEAFENIGIAVLKNAVEFRDFDSVLNDLAKKWANLSSVQKANLSITLSGVRRFSDFIALMDNYRLKLAATIISQRASNEAQQASQMIVETMAKQWASLKASMEEFSFAIGKALSGGLGVLIKFASGVLEIINSAPGIAKTVGAIITFGTVFASLSIAMVGANFGLSILRDKFDNLNIQMAVGTANAGRFSKALALLTRQASTGAGLTGFVGLLGKTNTIILGISTALAVIGTIMSFTSDKVQNFTQEFEDSFDLLIKDTNELKDKLDALEQTQELFTGLKDEVKGLAESLATGDKTSESYAANWKKLNTILDAAGGFSLDLSVASGELQASIVSGQVSLERFNKAVDDYNEKTVDAITFTKDLTDAQSKQAQEALKIRLSDLEQSLIGFATSLEAIKDNSSGLVDTLSTSLDEKFFKSASSGITLFRYSIENAQQSIRKFKEESQGQAVSFKDIVADQEFAEAVNSKLRLALESGDKQQFLRTFFETLALVSNKVGKNYAINIGDNFVKNLTTSFQDASESTAKNINAIVDKLFTAEQAAVIKIKISDDVNEIFPKINKLSSAYNVLIKQAVDGKENTDIIADKALQKTNEFSNDILNLVNAFNNGSRASEQIRTKITKLTETLTNLTKSRDKAEDSFFIGRKVPQELEQWQTKVKDLVREYDELSQRINISNTVAQFGSVLPGIDIQSYENAANLITKQSELFLDLRNHIKKLKKDQADLTTFYDMAFKTAKKSGKDYSATMDELKINMRDWANTAVGSLVEGANTVDNVAAKLNEINNLLPELEALSKRIEILPQAAESLRFITSFNERAKNIFKSVNIAASSFELMSAQLETQIGLLGLFEDKQVEVAELESKRVDLLNDYNVLLAQLNINREDKITSLLKAIQDSFENSVEAIRKIRDAKLAKLSQALVANANLARDTIAEAFNNIPDNILSGHDKRKELQQEIKDAEYEILEARREGDQVAAYEAKQRLRNLNRELDDYKRGWFEIRSVVLDIFGKISSTFWKNITDQLGKSISDLVIKDKSLGEVVAEKMALASGQLVDDWESVSTRVNEKFLTDYANLLKNFLKAQSELQTIGSMSPQGIETLTQGDMSALSPLTLDVMLDTLKEQKRLLEQSFSQDTASNKEDLPPSFKTSSGPIKSNTEALTSLTAAIAILEESLSIQSFRPDSNLSLPPSAQTYGFSNAEDRPSDRKQVVQGERQIVQLSKIETAVKSVATILGSTFATALTGTKNKGAQVGAGFGSMVGAAAGETLAGASKLASIFLPGIGSLLGGLAGGLFGGLFGGSEKEESKLSLALSDNTQAVNNNTLALKQLDKAIFNAPSAFNVPAFSGGFGGNVTVQVNGGDATEIANKVVRIIEQNYRSDSRASGTRGYRVA